MVLAGTHPPIRERADHPCFYTVVVWTIIRDNWIDCAVAVLRGESNVKGDVVLEQTSEDAPTKITYNITGMDPSSKRGFHVQ
jgi:hypothetical protein